VDKLSQVIGESYKKIADYLCSLGEQPMGVPYTAYYNMDMQDLDVEMGFPVSKALPESEEIKAREIEAQQVASTMYKGPYGKMEPTYVELLKWIEEKGYQLTGVSYEYYHNSPDEVPESELLTEIVLPVT
jgi:effector-binding domain-containing protein